MANRFLLEITAIDKATAVVRKVNSAFGKLAQPLVDVRSAVGRLAREAGFDRLGHSLTEIGHAAGDVGERLGRIAAPMAALIGVTSIAGVAALATEWGHLGEALSRSSAMTGVASGALQSLGGAARLTGASSEAMTGSLRALGNTMEDALFGRNQEALMLMSRLGITVRRTADGAIDSAGGFRQLADAIARVKNPQIQALIARTFGIDESLIPLMQRGAAGIKELEDRLRSAGIIMGGAAIARATAFAESLTALKLAAEGLRNTIGDRLIPAVMPLIEHFTDWITINRELIATKIGAFAEGLAHWLERVDFDKLLGGMAAFGRGIERVVGWLGGWENAAIAVVAIMNAGLIASIISLGAALINFGVAVAPVAVAGFALIKGGLIGLGAFLVANPIGVAIAGIALAGLAIYENWFGLGDFFKGLWDRVTGIFGNALTELRPITDLIAALSGQIFGEGWTSLGDTVAAIWDRIVGIFDGAWARIQPIVAAISGVASRLFGGGPAGGTNMAGISVPLPEATGAPYASPYAPGAAGALAAASGAGAAPSGGGSVPAAGGAPTQIEITFRGLPDGVSVETRAAGIRVQGRVERAMPDYGVP